MALDAYQRQEAARRQEYLIALVVTFRGTSLPKASLNKRLLRTPRSPTPPCPVQLRLSGLALSPESVYALL